MTYLRFLVFNASIIFSTFTFEVEREVPNVLSTKIECRNGPNQILFEQKSSYASLLFPPEMMHANEAVKIEAYNCEISNDEDALKLFERPIEVCAKLAPLSDLAMQLFAHSKMGSSTDEATDYKEKTDPSTFCVSEDSKRLFTQEYILNHFNKIKEKNFIELGHVKTKYLTNKYPSAIFPSKNENLNDNVEVSAEMVYNLTNLMNLAKDNQAECLYSSFLLTEASCLYEPLKNLTLSLFHYGKFQEYQATSPEIIGIYKNSFQMAFFGSPTFHTFPYIFTHILYSSRNPIELPFSSRGKGGYEGRGVIQLTTHENFQKLDYYNQECPFMKNFNFEEDPWSLDYFEFHTVFAQIRFLVKLTMGCENLKEFLEVVKPAKSGKNGEYAKFGKIYVKVYSEFVRALLLANRILSWSTPFSVTNEAGKFMFNKK